MKITEKRGRHDCVDESGTTFVSIDVGEHRLDIVTVFKGAFLLPANKGFGQVVIPAAFDHEGVPDFDLFGVGAVPLLTAPFEHLFISASMESPSANGVIVDAQKGHDSLVETLSQVGVQLGMKFTGSHESDFVEHAAKVNETADLIFG